MKRNKFGCVSKFNILTIMTTYYTPIFVHSVINTTSKTDIKIKFMIKIN